MQLWFMNAPNLIYPEKLNKKKLVTDSQTCLNLPLTKRKTFIIFPYAFHATTTPHNNEVRRYLADERMQAWILSIAATP